jgi:flagellar M-ring protein FliF
MAIDPAELQNRLAAMPMSRKITALIGIAGALAVVAVLFLWANQPTYTVLYSNLSPEDAGMVVQKLKEMKIPYEVSGPDTILVPDERVYELRLQMAGQGLPQGGAVGFELFDRNNLGMSDFVQKLNYRRALEGELSRTIGQVSEVQQARVHLMIPERTLFTDKKETSSASVVLKLAGGRVLSEGQVHGIVHLVASSVEGLDPRNVTVVDTHGNMLSKASDTSFGAQLSNFQAQYQKSLEKEMEGRIQSMLERAVGTGKVVARVSTLLDFKQVETTEEKYDPESAVVRSEQRVQENTSGSTSASGGVPGVLSNVPAAGAENPQTASGKGTSSQSKRNSETVNYDISKSVSRIIEPIGTVQRLSVAVLIDGTYSAGGSGNEAAPVYAPRSQEEMQKYEEIVKKAVGYNAERGDQVEVVNIPFETNVPSEEPVPAEASDPSWAFLMPFVKYGVTGLATILVFLFIVKPLMKTLTAPSGLRFPSGLPAGDLYGNLERGGAGQLGREAEIREQVLRLARENPQQTAKVIKAWISEK